MMATPTEQREKVITVTLKDCIVTYERGSGPGGQKRNKTETKVRVFHPPSGAVGVSDETRHQSQNKCKAFAKMAYSKEMQTWLKIESAKRVGLFKSAEETVEHMMTHDVFITEVKDEQGRWVKAPIED